MAKAYVFPGQGAQFVGMGKDLYETNPKAKELFDKVDGILGGSGRILTGLIGWIQNGLEWLTGKSLVIILL